MPAATGSGLFTTAQPVQGRFAVEGKPGKGGEIADLRKDVKSSLAPITAMTVQEFTDVTAGGAAVLKAATATVTTVVTLTAADLLAPGIATLAQYPRNVTFTTAGGTPADAPANAVITGKDVNGAVLTETVTLAQTATIASGVKCFSSITSIAYPVGDGAGATVAIGIGNAIGLGKPIKGRAGLVAAIKEIAVGAVVTTGTFALPAASAPNGSYTPAAAPNGTNDYAIYYEYDATLG